MASAYKVYENKGFVYKIITKEESDCCYVGSTTTSLAKRFSRHKSSYSCWKNGTTGKTQVFDIFDEFGSDNCKIVLLEIKEPPYIKQELLQLEQKWIDELDCVNKKPSFRSEEERKEYLKKYNKQPDVILMNRESDKRCRDKPEHKKRKKEYMNEYRKEYNDILPTLKGGVSCL